MLISKAIARLVRPVADLVRPDVDQVRRPGAIDIGADDPIVVAEADLVMLAVPLAEQESWLRALSDLVPGAALVTSLRSDEGVPAAAGAMPERFRFIPGHVRPAAGAGTVRGAGADPISGCAWAIAAPDGDEHAARLAAFVRRIGGRPRLVGDAAGLQAFLQEPPPAV